MLRSKIAQRFVRAKTMTFFWALLALALHVVPGAIGTAHAQGSRKDDIVFNSRGIPLAGASVRVCAMPAAGQPCTPLALIYSDVGLTQALANPTTTDGMGNYFFYAAPGQYEIEISGPNITDKQIPNVILPNDPSSPTFSGAVSAFSLSLGGNLTVSGNTTVVGSLASGTLTLNNQATPPGAAATGTVNLYTKTADMRLYYKDQTGTEIGPLGPGTGAQTNVSNTFTAPQNIDADFHTQGPNPSFDLSLFGGYHSGTSPPTITCNTTAASNQITCSGGVGDFLVGHGVAIPTAGVAPTILAPATAFPVSSMSVTSNVATVSLANAASFAPGSDVVIAGSSDSAFNGTFPVANFVNAVTFTFSVTHSNCSPCSIGGSATVIAVTPSAVTPQGILNGTTTWNYKVVAIGFHGELSPASPAFTTTSGAAALGVTSATLAANGCVENNGVMTFTTTAAHNFQSGVPVNIPRGTTGTTAVEGSWTIAATPTSTTFNIDIATLPNGTYCPSGGTAQVVAKNLVQWTMQPYTVMGYYIYRSQGAGAYSLAGISQGMDSAFIDWGLSAPVKPAYVPSTPPSSPTNGILATTITSIAGNTITLASNAVASLTGATVFHDNTPNFLAVCASAAMGTTGGTIFVPASNPQGALYVVNSPLNLAAGCPQNTMLQLGAQLQVNYPIIPGSSNVIEGTIQGAGGNGAGPSFGKYVTTRILGLAYPMFLMEPGSSSDVTFQNLNAECDVPYQSCFVQDQDNSGNNVTTITYDNVYMNGGNYAQPFKMGGGFNFNFRYGGIGTAALGWGIPPSLWDVVDMGFGAFSQQLAGIMEWDYTQMGGGEWLFDTAGETGLVGGTGHDTFYEVLNESSYYPSLRFNTGSNTINEIHIERMTYADPVGGLATPIVDLTNAATMSNIRVIEPSCATSSQAFFSGAALGGIDFVSGFSGCAPGLPSTTQVISTSLYGPATQRSYSNVPVEVTGTGQFYYPMGVPAAPASAVVSSGGAVPVGTHTYAITAIDANGRETTIGPSISATTTSGNQTVTVTPPTLPAGAVGYKPYRDGVLADVTPCATDYIAGSTPYVDSFTAACNNSPPISNTGVTSSLNSNGISTYQLKMANNFSDVISPAPLTAARTQTLPDVTGIVPVSSYVNSAYDNATRANGAIGSSWTVEQNGLNIASNQFQGTTTGTNSAFWKVNSFSNVQFAQATVTALNGTTDYPGVSVLASGTGSSSSYYSCLENTTTVFIQRVLSTVATNLTSTASTGAPGDILRIEAAPGGALTCYKNGAVALTFTDTQITSGSPGLSVAGDVATLKNWSGGNLHPIGHLDVEQDWTKTQHFTQGVAFGSETFSASPRGLLNVFLPGTLTSTWTGSTWTLDKAITVTRVQVQAKTAPAGCSTSAVVQLTDGTSPVNVTISAAGNDSGPITQNYAAAASLTLAVQTAAAGCSTSPADANVVVQYRMQ
ncbi:MAG TPA: hypothetical protein VL975_01155 [Candidatus Micrarchaeia archaeon]|nr:hypothetical protein [Candidatus Micrarchaeia archaeon]